MPEHSAILRPLRGLSYAASMRTPGLRLGLLSFARYAGSKV